MNARKIEIGALSIDVPARNAAHARVLAAAIEQRLRETGFPLPNVSSAIESLRVDLPPWPAWASDAHIAAVVASGVRRALEQALRSSGRLEPVPEASPDAAPGRMARRSRRRRAGRWSGPASRAARPSLRRG